MTRAIDVPRWSATVEYKTEEAGIVPVIHDIEELEELQDLVESGPDWNSIVKITIELSPRRRADYDTVEASWRS